MNKKEQLGNLLMTIGTYNTDYAHEFGPTPRVKIITSKFKGIELYIRKNIIDIEYTTPGTLTEIKRYKVNEWRNGRNHDIGVEFEYDPQLRKKINVDGENIPGLFEYFFNLREENQQRIINSLEEYILNEF